MRTRLPWTRLERVGVVVVALILAVSLIVVLSGYFSDHDPGGVSAAANQIGDSFPSLGDARLRPGERRPRYDSEPPTSGAHRRVAVRVNRQALSVDQLLTALAAGDIVVEYGGSAPPDGLIALADRLAGRFSPALAADGQAVVLARAPGTVGLVALAWTRMVTVSGPTVPLLRQFIQTWLGRGAG